MVHRILAGIVPGDTSCRLASEWKLPVVQRIEQHQIEIAFHARMRRTYLRSLWKPRHCYTRRAWIPQRAWIPWRAWRSVATKQYSSSWFITWGLLRCARN